VVGQLQPGDPERIGPYRVVGRLGSGGMGTVFLCRSAGGRPVAVKVIRADLASDREFRARFRREVEAARKVSGLYTALLVNADLDGPTPWLATAYVPGPSLADAVADHGPLPTASVFMLAAGLAESLVAIHAVGVVHRDLKPSNVLLADDGPRVIDFGISRAVEASALTRTGLVVGSPGFMSPEQAEGGQVDAPSDVFSLGARTHLRRHRARPVRHRFLARADLPRRAQRSCPRRHLPRSPCADRALPDQGPWRAADGTGSAD
jgi:eukaryotic-like serine/threonine-protein kinase